MVLFFFFFQGERKDENKGTQTKVVDPAVVGGGAIGKEATKDVQFVVKEGRRVVGTGRRTGTLRKDGEPSLSGNVKHIEVIQDLFLGLATKDIDLITNGGGRVAITRTGQRAAASKLLPGGRHEIENKHLILHRVFVGASVHKHLMADNVGRVVHTTPRRRSLA